MDTTQRAEGVCLFCGSAVIDGGPEAGAPEGVIDWTTKELNGRPFSGGDYGCEHSPATGPDGVGSHAVTDEEAREIALWALDNPPILWAGPFGMEIEPEHDPYRWI